MRHLASPRDRLPQRLVTLPRLLAQMIDLEPTHNVRLHFIVHVLIKVRRGSRVVSVLDSGAEGPEFKSQSRRCRVTVLGKLLTPIVPLFTKQQNWQQPS